MKKTDQIEFYSKHLKLDYIAQNHDSMISRASINKISYLDFLEETLKNEYEEGTKKSIQRRLQSAKLGTFKLLGEFDWLWPKKISKETISELMLLHFIKEKANIILLGPSGVGKTMIAKNIAYEAAKEGKTSLFIELADLIRDLEQQESSRLFNLRLNRYIKPSILVIDEVGYQSYATTKSADFLFQIINKRHEKNSTIITTNLAFQDWGQAFMNATSLVPMIDRLTQRAEILLIEGDSYRGKEARLRKKNKK